MLDRLRLSNRNAPRDVNVEPGVKSPLPSGVPFSEINVAPSFEDVAAYTPPTEPLDVVSPFAAANGLKAL